MTLTTEQLDQLSAAWCDWWDGDEKDSPPEPTCRFCNEAAGAVAATVAGFIADAVAQERRRIADLIQCGDPDCKECTFVAQLVRGEVIT